MIIPVQSHYHEGSSSEVKVGKICWKSWSERGKEWCMIKVPLNVTERSSCSSNEIQRFPHV